MPVKVMLHPAAARRLKESREDIRNNVAGFISWTRLVSLMTNTNEIAHNEFVEAFVLTDDGIQFFIEKR